MALVSAPSTPERGAQPPSIRRAFTAPIKSSRVPLPLKEAEAKGAETLFAHNATRIVSFTTTSSSGRRHSSVSDGRSEFRDEEAGSLPWASLTERTMASGRHDQIKRDTQDLNEPPGPLRIYRVLGSVAFLNSGTTLQPLLAKSQCWCVDGVSKFVLRIRANNYYRIELPHESESERQQVEYFKIVLDKVLQYERTPCPFKRGFTVDLPEKPLTPVLKKPWRPKHKDAPSTNEVSRSPTAYDELNNLGENAHRVEEESATELDDCSLENHPAKNLASYPAESSDGSHALSTDSGIDSEEANCVSFMENEGFKQTDEKTPHLRTPIRLRRIMNGRTVTAPPQLSLKSSPPSTTSDPATMPLDIKQESPSHSSSVDSFHSFHSPISPQPPSPPSSDSFTLERDQSTILVPRIRGHKRDESEATITTDSHDLWDLTGTKAELQADRPCTPALVSDVASQDDLWDEVKTPSPPGLRVRRTLQKRRAHSPLPSSQNLYSPYSPTRNVSSHHLTTAIIQRTCSFLLGPPIQLVALMLKIAARLARGAFQGSTFGFGEGGERIPCSWDFSSDGSDDSAEIWEEDDYGICLGKTVSGKDVRANDAGGSWEID